MDIPAMDMIQSREEARDYAIEWQAWQADQVLSYGELLAWEDYFRKLGRDFSLTDEFTENGII